MNTVRGLAIRLGIMLLTASLTAASDAGAGAPAREGDVAVVAAGGAGEGAARTFGTVATAVHTINAHAFVPSDSSVTYASHTFVIGDRFLLSAGSFLAGVDLPAGAVVLAIEIQGCDDSGSGALTASLRAAEILTGQPPPFTTILSLVTLGTVSTGAGPAPGCGYFFAPISPAPVVEHSKKTYLVEVSTGSIDGNTRFAAVRLYYRRQVSPAPATATFIDVPGGPGGHPFFQFIEALAAAGITGGCTAPPLYYCPDAFVTRGQMAVFFSRALGLHFAP